MSTKNLNANASAPTLLIVDDDAPLLRLLARAMGRKGYAVWPALSCAEAFQAIKAVPPDYAVVDLRLDDGSGLDVVEYLRAHCPQTTTVVLSGYANLSLTVSAIQNGAADCLPKPVDAEDLHKALISARSGRRNLPEQFQEPREVRLQHVLSRWEKNNRNTTKTAAELNLHRRSLQRLLRNAGVFSDHTTTPPPASMGTKLRRIYEVWARTLSAQ